MRTQPFRSNAIFPARGQYRLGAEELIELGQGPSVSSQRMVQISPDEGHLIVKTVENIIAFAQGYPIEFHSYCPIERWQNTLTQVGTWAPQIERQLQAGSKTVSVPAEMIFRLVDLEKCASAARESRLNAAKWAFGLSAGGTLANVIFGLTWVTVPTYIAGLAILFGGPLVARLSAEPQEPYKPSIGCRKAFSMGGCSAPHETDEEKAMIKLVERVVLAERPGVREHWWGTVDVSPGPETASTCIRKGRLRVRIEGWAGDTVVPAHGWEFSSDCEEKALNVIGVLEVDAQDRETGFGPIPEKSRHPDTFWVEYIGPKTKGVIRRAGPFGCPFDTRDHAVDDGGIKKRGDDGDYNIIGKDGEVVDVDQETLVTDNANGDGLTR